MNLELALYIQRTTKDIISTLKTINEKIFSHLSEKDIKKINVQFRPEADPKTYSRHFLDSKLVNELNSQLENCDPAIQKFANEKTNLYQVFNNSVFTNKKFNNCHMSLLQLKIDGKGDVYPCAQTANNTTDSYGNLFEENFFSNFKKAVKDSYSNHPTKICENCAQSSINSLYENHNPDTKTEELNNPFF